MALTEAKALRVAHVGAGIFAFAVNKRNEQSAAVSLHNIEESGCKYDFNRSKSVIYGLQGYKFCNMQGCLGRMA